MSYLQQITFIRSPQRFYSKSKTILKFYKTVFACASMTFIKMNMFCKVLICGLDTDSRLEHFKTFLKKTSFVVMVTSTMVP